MCAHGEGECEVGCKGRVWNIVVSTSRTCGRVAGGGVTGGSIAKAGGMEPLLGNSIVTGLLRTAGWAEGAEGVTLFPAYCTIWPVSDFWTLNAIMLTFTPILLSPHFLFVRILTQLAYGWLSDDAPLCTIVWLAVMYISALALAVELQASSLLYQY